MEKTTVRRKKQFVPNAFKFLVAVSSLAGTFGIWNSLAKKDLIQASAQDSNGNQPVSTDTLAPLPTLAPLITVDVTALNQQVNQPVNAPSATLKNVTAPKPIANNAVPSITNNSNQTVSSPVTIPAPVTTTQSSKKP
jgi:hypothetical protein